MSARDAAGDIVLPLPPNAPRVRPNAFIRWLGRSILTLGGWRMVGSWPDVGKLMVIAAPHSSNWDGIYGFAAKMAMGLEVKVLGKRELFWWPLGPVLRRLGVIGVDRNAARGVVEQVAAMIREHQGPLWFVIAPEGTRKRVERWKTGFWKIASSADVHVVPVYFHYPDRIIGVGELFHLGDDMDADMARIRAWYRPWQGKNRDTL